MYVALISSWSVAKSPIVIIDLALIYQVMHSDLISSVFLPYTSSKLHAVYRSTVAVSLSSCLLYVGHSNIILFVYFYSNDTPALITALTSVHDTLRRSLSSVKKPALSATSTSSLPYLPQRTKMLCFSSIDPSPHTASGLTRVHRGWYIRTRGQEALGPTGFGMWWNACMIESRESEHVCYRWGISLKLLGTYGASE